MRLPFRQIQAYLLTFHGLQVSLGEVVDVLYRIREHAQPVLDSFKAEMRASPAVQADETGWREDGSNGYIWSVSTPTLRYDEYHHSRAGEVAKELQVDRRTVLRYILDVRDFQALSTVQFPLFLLPQV
jgi:hypothetical protein